MLWILSHGECWVCSESLTFGFWAKLQSCSCKQAFLACQKAQWEIGRFFSCLHSQKVLHDLLLRNMFAEHPQRFASKKQGWFLSENWELWRSYGKLLLFLMVTVSARLKPALGCHLWLDLLTFFLLLSKEKWEIMSDLVPKYSESFCRMGMRKLNKLSSSASQSCNSWKAWNLLSSSSSSVSDFCIQSRWSCGNVV